MQMKNPEKYRVLTISVEVVVDALLITSIKQVLSLVEFQFQTENKIKMTNWLWVGSVKNESEKLLRAVRSSFVLPIMKLSWMKYNLDLIVCWFVFFS